MITEVERARVELMRSALRTIYNIAAPMKIKSAKQIEKYAQETLDSVGWIAPEIKGK